MGLETENEDFMGKNFLQSVRQLCPPLLFVNKCDALCNLASYVQFKQLQASILNFTKCSTLPLVVFTFLKLHKWYQIVQIISNLQLLSLLTNQ